MSHSREQSLVEEVYRLREELKKANKDRSDFESQTSKNVLLVDIVKKLRTALEGRSNEINKLKSDIEGWISLVKGGESAAVKQHHFLIEQIRERDDRIMRLEQKYERFTSTAKTEVDAVRKHIEGDQKERLQLIRDVKDKQLQVDQLEADLSRCMAERAVLEDSLRSEKQRSASEMAALRERYDEVQLKNDSLQQDAMKQRHNEYSSEISELRKEIEVKANDILNLQRELRASQRKCESLQVSLSEERQTVREMSEAMNTMHTESTTLTGDIDVVSSRLSDLRSANSDLQEEVKSLKSRLHEVGTNLRVCVPGTSATDAIAYGTGAGQSSRPKPQTVSIFDVIETATDASESNPVLLTFFEEDPNGQAVLESVSGTLMMRVKKRWIQYFFCIGTGQVQYFDSEDDLHYGKRPSGVIPLQSIEVVEPAPVTDTGMDHSWYVRAVANRRDIEYVLSAETEERRVKWMNAIINAIKKAKGES